MATKEPYQNQFGAPLRTPEQIKVETARRLKRRKKIVEQNARSKS